MRNLEPPGWSYFRAAWGVIVLGVGWSLVVSAPELAELYGHAGRVLVTLGLLLLVSSLRPTLQSLPIVRAWRNWRGKKIDRAKAAVELAKQQRELEPDLVAFDMFYPSAVSVLGLFYRLHNSGGSEGDWQAFQRDANRAVSLAGHIPHEGTRYYALQSLAPFLAPIDRDRIDSYKEAAGVLAVCLSELERYYSTQRQRAELPKPRNWPTLPSAGPPPSKASAQSLPPSQECNPSGSDDSK